MHNLALFPFLVALFAASTAIALDGDRGSVFGEKSQVVIAKPEQNGGNNAQPMGVLGTVKDRRLPWAALLADAALELQLVVVAGLADAIGIARSAMTSKTAVGSFSVAHFSGTPHSNTTTSVWSAHAET